jgi:hypothetical protein
MRTLRVRFALILRHLPIATGLNGPGRGKSIAPLDLCEARHVGFETNLRKPAIFLFIYGHCFALCVHVSESLALADDLFRRWFGLPGRWIGCAFKAPRLSGL